MNKIMCPRCWNDRSRRCDKCDNKGSIYDSKLSQNFTLGELTYSPTAKKRGIPNDPTIKEVDRLGELALNLLQPLRDSVGLITITSGYRSPELNKAIGGAKDSAHMLAWAADIQPEHVLLNDVMHWFHKSPLPFDQVILEYGRREDAHEDDWVHIGYKNSAGQQRRQMLVMRNGIYTPWVI